MHSIPGTTRATPGTTTADEEQTLDISVKYGRVSVALAAATNARWDTLVAGCTALPTSTRTHDGITIIRFD